MNTQELHPIGNFNNWNPKILAELREGNYTNQVGEKLIFENEVLDNKV